MLDLVERGYQSRVARQELGDELLDLESGFGIEHATLPC